MSSGNGNTAQKTARRIPGRPFSKGPDPRRGHGVKGKGRPPNWLKDWCDELLASEKSKAAVEKILSDRDHPAFAVMWRTVADRAHGKPEQSVKHSGTVNVEHLLLERAQRANGDRNGS